MQIIFENILVYKLPYRFFLYILTCIAISVGSWPSSFSAAALVTTPMGAAFTNQLCTP